MCLLRLGSQVLIDGLKMDCLWGMIRKRLLMHVAVCALCLSICKTKKNLSSCAPYGLCTPSSEGLWAYSIHSSAPWTMPLAHHFSRHCTKGSSPARSTPMQ